MANIKISELNELTAKDNSDLLPIVDVSGSETKKIQVSNLLDKNIELLAVTDTPPSTCSTGDKYYNTSTKKIYTATGTNTWGTTGADPISGILYIVYADQASYSWDGTDLVSVGGGKEDIVIDDDEPTDPDVKLWIDTGEVGSQASEITNEYSTSTGVGYSANYVNNLNTYSTNEQRIGTWIDGKPLYRKVIDCGSNVTINAGDWASSGKTLPNCKIIINSYGCKEADATSQIRATIGTNDTIMIMNPATFTIVVRYIIVEYTKTTD